MERILDRLSRNVAFIANLLEAGVDFVAVDMPHANKLSIHILGAAFPGMRSACQLAVATSPEAPLDRPVNDFVGAGILFALLAYKAADLLQLLDYSIDDLDLKCPKSPPGN